MRLLNSATIRSSDFVADPLGISSPYLCQAASVLYIHCLPLSTVLSVAETAFGLLALRLRNTLVLRNSSQTLFLLPFSVCPGLALPLWRPFFANTLLYAQWLSFALFQHSPRGLSKEPPKLHAQANPHIWRSSWTKGLPIGESHCLTDDASSVVNQASFRRRFSANPWPREVIGEEPEAFTSSLERVSTWLRMLDIGFHLCSAGKEEFWDGLA